MRSLLDQRARQRLEEWLISAAGAPSVAGASADIHIDELTPKLGDRSMWVQGGFDVLESAVDDRVRDGEYIVCLVFHLDAEADIADLGIGNPREQWTSLLGISPPELVLIRPENWSELAVYLRDSGRVLGTLSLGELAGTVHLTERVEPYGDQREGVRHIWVVVPGQAA